MDHLRHYSHPMVQRHLFNEIDGAAVDTMMQVTEFNYGLGRDYFKLKAQLLDLPGLALYDQYAPVGKEVRPFPYHQAQQVILEAFGAFTPVLVRSRQSFLSSIGSTRKFARENAAAPFAPRRHRCSILIFCATIPTTCVM